ncbi:MAG: aspartate kinase [Candidatus Eisenbacteria sp.]|nr:aspartate kinase [Candidatus Eisenbacteria bacterium]MCK5596129.1 aspartate kinase [Candidatus Eisenbacteria bacterium]
MSTIVQKYGGTSIDGREKIVAIAERLAALRGSGHDVVVVVSAPGGTTNSLLRDATALAAEPNQRELDMLMTAGERISMSLLAIALNSIGCPAISFTGSQVGIITDTKHTDARILEVRPDRVVRELASGNVVVVGGFQGVSTAKNVTTLGRGGSDTTAVALAAALGAERCEILTDVDGVYTADPNTVPAARKISEISFEDMSKLARYGATVLKEDAVRFAEENGITLHVRKSVSDTAGTIVLDEPTRPCPPVAGLSLLEDVELLTWERMPATAAAEIGELSDRVKFVLTLGDQTLVAVERVAMKELLERSDGSMSARRAHLICAVGRDAGSAVAAAAISAAVTSTDEDLLAMVSEGRSTVVAVRPDGARRVLEALHDVFFQPARTER